MPDKLKRLSPGHFPELLREIPDPPSQLYLAGTLPTASHRLLAVVGSRALSSYGRQVCDYLLRGLKDQPIAIVSGLAYGADAEAHRVALDIGLPCIAVPGSGLDPSVLYPRANVRLAEHIVASGGALISEFEPLQRATDYTFPKRNRIMAGMSHATLVIEAKERSGTLITARLVTEYNRELLVVPGSIFSETSKGAHQFLKLGATAVTEPDDILRALRLEPALASAPELTDTEKIIFEVLAEPLSRDALFDALSLDVTEAQVTLATMEIKGLIVEEMGVIRRAR